MSDLRADRWTDYMHVTFSRESIVFVGYMVYGKSRILTSNGVLQGQPNLKFGYSCIVMSVTCTELSSMAKEMV